MVKNLIEQCAVLGEVSCDFGHADMVMCIWSRGITHVELTYLFTSLFVRLNYKLIGAQLDIVWVFAGCSVYTVGVCPSDSGP